MSFGCTLEYACACGCTAVPGLNCKHTVQAMTYLATPSCGRSGGLLLCSFPLAFSIFRRTTCTIFIKAVACTLCESCPLLEQLHVGLHLFCICNRDTVWVCICFRFAFCLLLYSLPYALYVSRLRCACMWAAWNVI